MNPVRSSLLALATAAAVLAPATAYAGSTVTSDPKGDVLVYDFGPGSETPTKDPTVKDGDIVSSAVSFAPRRVTMAMHFRDLSMTPNMLYGVFRVLTDEGRVREVQLTAAPGHWSGVTSTVNGQGAKVRCRGVRHSIYYTANLMRVSIPASCLGRPRWIKAGLGAVEAAEPTFLVDDGHTDGKVYDEPKWGTRVYR